jgi:hypothetical protein
LILKSGNQPIRLDVVCNRIALYDSDSTRHAASRYFCASERHYTKLACSCARDGTGTFLWPRAATQRYFTVSRAALIGLQGGEKYPQIAWSGCGEKEWRSQGGRFRFSSSEREPVRRVTSTSRPCID